MTNTLIEINEVVNRRISQLLNDISEAEALLHGYRAELDPLLKIAQVTGDTGKLSLKVTVSVEKTPEPPVEAVKETVEAKEEGGEESVEDVIPSRRWSRFNLPPRHRRFLDRFAGNERITRAEASAWYKRALNPGISDNSLSSNVSEITRDLLAKGILRKIEPGVWSIIR